MKLIRPTDINDAALVSSSVPETDFAAWSGATTYALNAKAIKTSTHRIYQSLAAGNLNHDPETNPDKWLDIGPTNRWAMFDKSVGTLTTATHEIDVSIAPGSIDSLALLDLQAETARVTMVDGGVTVYDRTQATNVGGVAIVDWYSYFFEAVGVNTTLTFLDLPIHPNATVAISVQTADPADTAAIGTCVVGRLLEIGTTEVSPSVGIDDYSKKNTDDFGVTTVVPRAWAGTMTLNANMLRANIDAVRRILADLRATACVWIGQEGYDSLTLYGFYKSFEIKVEYETACPIALTIESLT
jgi:hypothetical protein